VGPPVGLIARPGRQVFNLVRPFGSELPPAGNPGLVNQVFTTNAPAISDLFSGGTDGTPIIAIGVPVEVDGRVRYSLSVSFTTSGLRDLLDRRATPSSWVGTLVDRHLEVIARTRDAERWVGHPATPRFIVETSASTEGTFRATAREGVDAYSAFARLPLTGWTIVLATPVASVDAPLRRSLWTIGGAGLAGLLLAAGLATLLGRRLAGSIGALSREADAVGRGEPPGELRSRVREIDDASRALMAAARRRGEVEAALRALAETGRELTETLEPKTVSARIVETVVRLLDARRSILYRLDRDSGDLVPVAVAGEKLTWASLRVPYGAGLSGAAIREGQCLSTGSALTDPRIVVPDGMAQRLASEGTHAVMAAPLRVRHETLGTITVAGRGERPFDDENRALLSAFADQAAIALENARLYDELRAATIQLGALSRRLIDVQEDERRWLARELHDEVGQVLTALTLELDAMRAAADLGVVATRVDSCVAILDDLVEQIRQISLNLRPSILDDLGLEAAVRWYVRQHAERAALPARVDITPLPVRPRTAVETACFRLLQEAMTNVLRHAHARHVHVSIRRDTQYLRLEVADDGMGFDVSHAAERGLRGEGLGLIGMRERAVSTGGRFEIDSTPGHGCAVRAWLPLA
jgi:signal transduction histidine kinase